MKVTPVVPQDLRGVFAVPPLARSSDAHRTIDFAQNDLIVRHIIAGGIARLIYGGNAFLYHITLTEYAQLLEWLASLAGDVWVIPSMAPSFGQAMDQALLLRKYQFPCAMILPCSDPRDAAGLERGYREIAEAAGKKLIVYLKEENNFGSEKEAGLDAVSRLVDDGICVGIKYAVVTENPAYDPYLKALLERVDRSLVISGIGERPAVVHMRDWRLPGFTTGSGCIAPLLSEMLFLSCERGDVETEKLRQKFIPLEDLRDRAGPARVLHHATELAGIARTGAVPPYISALTAVRLEEITPVAQNLVQQDREARTVSRQISQHG